MIRMRNNDEKVIGRRMILSAIKMEEALAKVIQVETQLIRTQLKDGNFQEDVVNFNKTIKNICHNLSTEVYNSFYMD